MNRINRRKFLKYAFAGAVAVVAYPFFIERYIIQTNYYKIYFKNLPKAFDGFRIVQLTDLHYGFLVPERIIKHVVNRANNIDKDIIVCTGDYVHERNTKEEIHVVWPYLKQLQAPLGVYSVLGNHDHWANQNESLKQLQQSGQNIRHQSKEIQKNGQSIWIGGAGDFWEDETGLQKAFETVPDDAFKLVLAHNPDTADTNLSVRIDLMLCGHTHGGQVRIPFFGTPILPVRNKTYNSGIFNVNNFKLFISKGIGWAIIPIRFNCMPEIAVIELKKV